MEKEDVLKQLAPWGLAYDAQRLEYLMPHFHEVLQTYQNLRPLSIFDAPAVWFHPINSAKWGADE